MKVVWETAQHSTSRTAQFVDINGHRLYVHRTAKGARTFVGRIDGEQVGVYHTMDMAKSQVAKAARERGFIQDNPLVAKIEECWRMETLAMKTEMTCVRSNDHAGAAKAHADRHHWLERAGMLIEQMPHIKAFNQPCSCTLRLPLQVTEGDIRKCPACDKPWRYVDGLWKEA